MIKEVLKSMNHTEHRLGPTYTTQPLPRQAEANVLYEPSNYIQLNHSKLGGTPRFSPRQVLDRVPLVDGDVYVKRPINLSLNQPPSSSSVTQIQEGS